ncbi:MAG TPA: septal ring lytic transglycosylase RlpA family protein [Methylophilaceae bacterium]|jgi:rare lipoprotein A
MKSMRLILLTSLVLLLAACGSANVKPDKPAIERKDVPGTTSKSAAPSKPGGYYLDDGPGDNPPPDIDSIPNAVPRVEAPLPRANRPYSALGVRYTPMTEYAPYKERGIASWYGKRYHGQKTSSGEIYDMYSMSAAHTTLPLPSYARVTNPENGRSVIVRINDRGPFHSDRLIDLSYAAAYKLRLTGKGSGLVEVEAIDARASDTSKLATVSPASTMAAPPAVEAPEIQPSTPQPPPPAIKPGNGATTSTAGDFIQVGAFKYKGNADLLIDKLKQQNLAENVALESWYNDGTYRVRLGPYNSRQDAERAAMKIRQALSTNAIVIHQQ